MTIEQQSYPALPVGDGFLMIPNELLDSPAWMAMTALEVKMLMELARLHRGYNNGDLSAAFSDLKKRGWRSKASISKALRGLKSKGLIQETRPYANRECALYALTWKGIDDGHGKHMVDASETPSNRWRSFGKPRPSMFAGENEGLGGRNVFWGVPAPRLR